MAEEGCLILQAQQARAGEAARAAGAITIRDGPASAPTAPPTQEDERMQADADYARQMQAKLDAKESRGPAGGNRYVVSLDTPTPAG